MRGKRVVAATLILLACYISAPALYLLSSNELTPEAYQVFIRTSPLKWSSLLSAAGNAPPHLKGLLYRILAQTPERYWSTAMDALLEAPPHRYEDTVYVLLEVEAEHWWLILKAVKLFKEAYRPFTPPSEELELEYVEQLAISGEEPVEDWRYMVYIFTYRLVYSKEDVKDAAEALLTFVHSYMSYDEAFWHRKSPKTLIRQRMGTCTNFSILFVAMCRSMGIPARLVRDNSISPATHAWSEFYVEGEGWVHADPSAGYFNQPQAYRERWGYRYHLVKAFSPLKGWVNVTPIYVSRYGSVLGLVLLDGKPVKEAAVSIYYPGNPRIPLLTLKTGEDGGFSFTAAEGSYMLTATLGEARDVANVVVQVNSTSRVELNLERRG